MKPPRTHSILCVVFLLFATTASGATRTNAVWEKMKLLVGDWEGTMTHGEIKVPVRVSYALVSGGTSLMERLSSSDDGHDMITMYHPDGPRVMMTHYCSEGNQPRMRADAADGDVVTFSFVDATNLSSPQAEHMRKLVVKFADADHFTQEWTHRKAGKEETGIFRYTRKK